MLPSRQSPPPIDFRYNANIVKEYMSKGLSFNNKRKSTMRSILAGNQQNSTTHELSIESLNNSFEGERNSKIIFLPDDSTNN